MRALHIFPLFGHELTNGSEHYEYMLSRKLVELGVNVDVLTTRAQKIRATSYLSLAWDDDYSQTFEQSDGMNIYRFSTSFALPRTFGRAFSVLLRLRWQREEQWYGSMVKGSEKLVDYYYRRVINRPIVYDWMALAGLGPWSLPLLSRLVKAAPTYDVLMVGFMPLALIWQVSQIAKRLHKPLVILALFHPDDLYHHHKSYYRCFAQAEAVLTQTSYSTALFSRLFPGCRPLQVGAGVDQAALTSGNISGARFRAKYGLGDQQIVLFVGRKEYSKRYDLAIKAVDLLGRRDVKLVMIGGDADAKPIASPHVLYLNKLPRADLLDAYDACDIFLLPSEYESFGIVFLEAWMRKKPVIGNALCKPVAALIEDGHDGFVCATADQIAARIALLLDTPELAAVLGQAGYQKVHLNYTWDTIGSKVYQLYAQLADVAMAVSDT